MSAQTLNRWRHLIEPETSGGLTPVPWEQVLQMPLHCLEAEHSVLVLRVIELGARKSLSIWVAAGRMDEVMDLINKAETFAKAQECQQVVFMGRRGWIRAAHGYNEVATIGVKEL